MFKIRIPHILITLAAIGSIAPACGILTAPVSVPEAISENANFSLKGDIVDQDSHPLADVLMAKEWHHHLWEPISGGTDTNEKGLQKVDKTFSVTERGSDLDLTFTKDGFYDAHCTFSASNSNVVSTPDGDWPIAKNFPVVLYSRSTPDEQLIHWTDTFDYRDYQRAWGVDLNLVRRKQDGRDVLDVGETAKHPEGYFYLTLTKQDPAPLNAKGDIDPTQVNLPAQITLHITGPDAGFIRIEPRLGFHPIRSADLAPTAGYSSEFTIDRKRLQEMRTHPDTEIMSAHEFFYFHAAGHYGKGSVEWTQSISKNEKSVHPVTFTFHLWLQPKENDPHLVSRSAKLR